jgi:hypothetical protein
MQPNATEVLGGWRFLWFRQMTRKSQNRCSFPFTVAGIALIGALTLTPEAKAQVTQLACSGTIRVVAGGISSPEEPWSFSVIIDMDKKSVTVNDYEPVELLGGPSANTVAFLASQGSNYGVSTGTLNRITGEASIRIIKHDGLWVTRGICKPAKKLF